MALAGFTRRAVARSDHPIVQQVAEAGRRILAKPPNRKKALEVSEVTRVICRLEQGHLGDIQVAALFALGFFGFLRWDDLLTIFSLQIPIWQFFLCRGRMTSSEKVLGSL